MSYNTPALTDYTLVKKLSDLPDPSAGVITISGGAVQVNGTVDITPNRLVIGAGAFVYGLDFNIDGITTNNAGALFTVLDNTSTIQNLTCENPNATGSLFDYDGTGVEPWVLQEIVSFTTPIIGNFEDFANLVIQNCAFLFFTTGITFSGSSNGNYSFDTTLFSAFTGVAFDLGTAVVLNQKTNN